MVKIYQEADADESNIKDKRIAILGYRRFAWAQSLCLRDGNYKVLIGEREGGENWDRAAKDGFEVVSYSEAVRQSNLILFLTDYEEQGDIFEQFVKPNLQEGDMLVFSSGFSIAYGQIIPPSNIDVVLIAPKAPSNALREFFKQGIGVPAFLAIEQDFSGNALQVALGYCKAIGCAKGGLIETTFLEEAETDLFGEQVVLTGGLVTLVRKAFKVLTDAGYPPEVAYFECAHEVMMVAQHIQEGGIRWALEACSPTAAFGGLRVGDRLINEQFEKEMVSILKEVQDGTFTGEWVTDYKNGFPRLNAMKRTAYAHPMEEVGRNMRKLLPWIVEKG
jgi:ketol-acid reductoisomerase